MGRVTIPQARMLMKYSDKVDGHREVSRTLVEIVGALFGGKPENKNKAENKAGRQSAPSALGEGIVVLDDLYEAVRERMKSDGWTPPP